MEMRQILSTPGKIAWSLLIVVSAGLLAWAPFIYIAVKRGTRSDWVVLAAIAAASIIEGIWAGTAADGPGDPFLGMWALLVLGTSVVLLWLRAGSSLTKADSVAMSDPSGRQFLQ